MDFVKFTEDMKNKFEQDNPIISTDPKTRDFEKQLHERNLKILEMVCEILEEYDKRR